MLKFTFLVIVVEPQVRAHKVLKWRMGQCHLNWSLSKTHIISQPVTTENIQLKGKSTTFHVDVQSMLVVIVVN